jgi:Na+-driven multidrug efflux pump
MAAPQWMVKLMHRWQLKSIWQVVIVLVVFACTGFTVLAVKKPLLNFLAAGQSESTLASVLYYIFILPIYNVFLLAYGFLFGQFRFFWEFEKRTFNRIFRRSKK